MNDNSRPPLAEGPKINEPPVLSTVDYEDADEKDNSEYQVTWSNTMEKGTYKSSSSYKNAYVLLLRWAEGCDDLIVDEEVSKLKRTFETCFGYHAEIQYLNAKSGRSYQVQVNTIVQAFIGAHDHPNALLIVYYAGHGKPGSFHGSLALHGQTSENDKCKKNDDNLVWNKTEKLLADAEGHVLEIFDCCYAGNLTLTRGDDRLFEYLAATKIWGTTKVPGPDSFTSALIYALEALVKEKGRFTTVELLRKITKDAPNFPKDQKPVLSDRREDVYPGRIMLHPLEGNQEVGPRTTLVPDNDSNLDAFNRYTMTLHVEYSKKPSLTDVETLGEQMNQSLERNNLNVTGVRYGGMKASAMARALRSFQAGPKRRRASMEQLQVAPDGDGSQSGSNGCDSALLTPSPSNGDSPRPMEFTATGNMAISSATLPPVLSEVSLDVRLHSQRPDQGQQKEARGVKVW